ncbi:MAG TPA: hypothetical protein VE074_03720 [Jatrophihabitantaceae bacterium]|nr:hypothetical protein [Jatrophihabitantaceae bacterium]
MGGIKWYEPLELPADLVAAATACLSVDPSRPPGSSCDFFAAAGRLSLFAQAFRDALGALARIAADDSAWTGEAADSFRTVLEDPQRTHADQVPARYDGYARALREYASTLDGHQSAIDSARAAVGSTLDTYRLRAAAAAPAFPRNPALRFPPGAPPVGPVVDPTFLERAAAQDCRAAVVRFQTAYNAWIDSARRCQRAVKAVDGDKLHNPHGASAAGAAIDGAFHAFVDATADVAGLVSTLTAALAVLTIPWPPAAAMFLLVSTVASGVQLLADVDRKLQYHENVSLGDLAFDALGTIPLAKPGSEALKGGRALKGAGVVGKFRAVGAKFATSVGSDLRGTFGPGAKDVLRGLRTTKARPDLKAGRAAFDGPGAAQDWGVNAAQAGTEAYDNRKRGARAVEQAAFEVVLGPAGPLLVGATNTAIKNVGGLPRLAYPGVVP